MTVDQSSGERIRAAEVIGAACLATDLGMGFPFEHGLHATLMAMRLADVLGVDDRTAAQTYHASLLMYSGCTTDAHLGARIFPGDLEPDMTHRQFGTPFEMLGGVARGLVSPGGNRLGRAIDVGLGLPRAAVYLRSHFVAMCEVAVMFADRLGLPADTSGMFHLLTERWDGHGLLGRAREDDIPLALRIVHVARDAAYQEVVHGRDAVRDVILRRAGHAFDPHVASVFAGEVDRVLDAARSDESAWDAVLSVEPRPFLNLGGEAIDRALAALGDFGDMVSPYLAGHARGVSSLAAAAAKVAGFDAEAETAATRAALVHDLGRAAVHPRIWNTEGPLSAHEWEQVRLHAYHSERVLARSPFLAALGAAAGGHHERGDGSGYHRGVAGSFLAPAARLLAAADAFRALQEPRPHREASDVGAAAEIITAEARQGRLDPEMVAAVLEAAGQTPLRMERPAGLSGREVEVVTLLARGLQTKQVARELGIAVKTADRHVQNAYRKMGVSTRAAATLFAAEHGLVPWGELPMAGGGGTP